MLLTERPILRPQEVEGNYNFIEDVRVLVTPGFLQMFGEEANALVLASQYLIVEAYERPDYLQVFTYKGIKYYCISNFQKGEKASDYEDTPYPYITFLLPSEY